MSNEKISLLSSDIPSLLAIVYKFSDWLITLLQLYIVINSALVGWILSTKPLWQAEQKIIVTIIYSLAMSINFVWMFRLHSWLKKILIEIDIAAENVAFASFKKNIKPIITSVFKRWWWCMLFTFHVISDAAVVVCILTLTNNK